MPKPLTIHQYAGAYSTVLVSNQSDFVIKMTSHDEDADGNYQFYKWLYHYNQELQYPFFPRVYAFYDLCREYGDSKGYLVVLEKLKLNVEQATRDADSYHPDYCAALSILNQACGIENYMEEFDIHHKNILYRKNQLVINDPFVGHGWEV